MNKLKVITIVGTRPEIIRLSRVLSKLDKFSQHLLVHTGQNYDYELNQIFFDELGIKAPAIYLDATHNSDGFANTIGNIITSIDKVLEEIKPDAVLVLGDTNSCLSVIPAKRRKIPIFHMEAGNRCFDLRVPEEINRKIIDHTSDINITYSSIARSYLLKEGLPPDQVIKVGSPMFEILNFYKGNILGSKILKRLQVKKNNYFVISAHREENIDTDKFESLIELINSICEIYKLPVIISLHPRTKKRLEAKKNLNLNNLAILMKPLGYFDYVYLQMNSKCVLSDSGTITEESSILGFNAINIRESHERPEGMEEASVMMLGLTKERVLQGIEMLCSKNKNILEKSTIVYDYSSSNISDKIIKIIYSYTDYVNRVVWKKY